MSPQTTTTQQFLNDARSLRQRVDDIEQKMVPSLVQNIGREFDGLKTKTDFMAEWLDALVGVVGLTEVEAAVLATRTKKALAEAEVLKVQIADEKAKGLLVNVDKVDDNCFVVLTETKNDTNEPVGAGWFKLHITQLKPEFRDLFKDKAPGFTDRREENTIGLVEILKAVPQAPKAPEPAPVA
jgi:hypothetical protein